MVVSMTDDHKWRTTISGETLHVLKDYVEWLSDEPPSRSEILEPSMVALRNNETERIKREHTVSTLESFFGTSKTR